MKKGEPTALRRFELPSAIRLSLRRYLLGQTDDTDADF